MGLMGISGNHLTETGLVQNRPAVNVRLAGEEQEVKQNIWDQPQGIVSISVEGKKMLEESQAELPEKEILTAEPVQPENQITKTEKSPEDKLYDQIGQVEKRLADIGKNNTEGKRTEDTDNEYAEAIEELRKLREDQAKQYEEEAEEAKKRAMANSKHLSDMEKGNRDLVIMLETMKGLNEDKKAKHGMKKDRGSHEDDLDRPESIQDISGQIRSEAAAKEEDMDAVLNDIHKKAQDGFSKAGKIGKDVRKQLDELKDFVADTANSIQDREEAVSQFVAYSEPLLNEMQDTRMVALQRMKIFKEVSLKRLGNQNMIKAQQAQEEVQAYAHQAAVADAFDAAYESRQRDKIDELEERIKELQGIDSAPSNEEGENPLIPEDTFQNLSEKDAEQNVNKEAKKDTVNDYLIRDTGELRG